MRKELPSASLSAAERYQELNTRQVATFIGVINPKTVWDYVKEGRLPKPRYLKSHQPLWRLGEVLDHTHARMKGYDEETRGFIGSERVRAARAAARPGTAERLRERLFGRGGADRGK